jgi:hypothetical protein
LFFSFFKGQSSVASHHTHSGSVISPVISPSGKVETPWDFAHAAHTIFSIVLLLSLVWGWVRSLSAKNQAQGVEGAKKVLSKGSSATFSNSYFLVTYSCFACRPRTVRCLAPLDSRIALLFHARSRGRGVRTRGGASTTPRSRLRPSRKKVLVSGCSNPLASPRTLDTRTWLSFLRSYNSPSGIVHCDQCANGSPLSPLA